MTLTFDFDHIRSTEFGVGTASRDGRRFSSVSVDKEVQTALNEMAVTTWSAMQELTAKPRQYEPSEPNDGTKYIYLPVTDALAQQLSNLHSAQNLPLENSILSDTSDVFCYFARFIDSRGRRLTGVRRATQFKGVLKNRLIRFVSDALTIVEDRVFKLDNDYDLLVDSQNIHILRPAGFEVIGQLHEAIMAAVPSNVAAIQAKLAFVDFSEIQTYASKHPRAARYLASIKAGRLMENIDKGALKRLCQQTDVPIQIKDNKMAVDSENVMGFLEVLDRRRYELDLVKGSPERFRAGSRQRING